MQLHRCRFVEWQPSAIVALAFAPISSSLAVARDNGDIELWSVPIGPPHCALRIPGRKSLAVKALAWSVHEEQDENSSDDDSDSSEEAVKGVQPTKRKKVQPGPTERTRKERLFSAALNGQITEWDLATLRSRASSDSYGGGVWSLACNAAGTLLAAACEDGSVRLFDTSDDSMRYMRALPTQPQRALSVAFHADGLELVAGYGDGCIRRWHTRTAQAAYRLTVEAQDSRSGDSLGKTRFWDGRHGTLLHSFDQHTADVLCLAKNKMENKVWSAGIDAKVSLFQLMQDADSDGRRWLHTHSQRAHTHDMYETKLELTFNNVAYVWLITNSQALACAGQTLVSGGLDTLLQVYSTADFDTRAARRVLPYPHRSVVHSSPTQRLLLSVSDHALDFHRLVSDENYAHLARINLAGDLNVTSSALSPNGSLVACSDAKQLRLFKLEITPSSASASAITSPTISSRHAYAMCFSPDSTRLCTASDDGTIHLFDVSKDDPSLLHTFSHTRATLQQKMGSREAPVTSVCISADNCLLASGDSNSVVHVFDVTTGKHYTSLPLHTERLRQISFHPRQHLLVALYANNNFVFYDCDERRLSDWSREYGAQLPADNALLARKEPLLGVAWNPAKLSSVIFYGEAFLCHVDLDMPVPGLAKEEKKGKNAPKDKKAEKEKRKPKRGDGESSAKKSGGENFSCVTKYRPLMHAAFLGPDEVVVVERPWVRIAQALPEALHRHTYRSGA